MTGSSPLPGTIGLTRIRGVVGWLIAFGQLITGDASRYSHVFVVLDDGTAVEAMPGGARITPLSAYEGRQVAYGWMVPLTGEQRAAIVRAARSYVGVPYGFSDYLALALARLGIRPAWLRRYIAASGRMICSQLADQAYRDAGVVLFGDGRLPQDVTPGDLANLFIERADWAHTPVS